MPLGPGARLGPYEIVSAIGAGGMGEVYKAKDTRLDRTVAIKVLPSHVSDDPALRERFEREARTIAALNHPNICTLHDVGHQDGTDYLVLECLEGQTLADRLTRGALPLEQALAVAIQIADALDKAHRAGIVHRDLKPGNIMLTKSGAKLLDFGLAKLTPAVITTSGLSLAPTMQSPATIQGTILGTLQYMAPEQVEGRDADARSDIFAFGAVLYEMIAGERAFDGKSQAGVIAAIISGEPKPLNNIQPSLPEALKRTIARCLSKEADDRWQTVRDLMEELRWTRDSHARATDSETTKGFRRHTAWAWVVAGIVSAAAVATWIADARRAPPPAPMMRFTIPIKADLHSPVSPDGRQLAYVSTGSLFLRSLTSATDRRLDTGILAVFVEWSPDSRSLLVSGEGKLVRVNLPEGQTQTLCDLPATSRNAFTLGLAWSDADTVLFSGGERLYQVPASGGMPSAVTTLDQGRGDVAHLWPQFLPDGRRFIFLVQARNPADSGIYLGSLDSPNIRLVLHTDRMARLVGDHLLFVRGNALMAQRVDASAMQLESEPVQLANEVGSFVAYGAALFSASNTGVLVYSSSYYLSAQRQLQWFDRTGTSRGNVDDPAPGYVVNLSPDETRVATTRFGSDQRPSVWITDLKRNVGSALDSERTGEFDPTWAPDGSRIAFSSDRDGPMALFQKSLAGGVSEHLQSADASIFMSDWSRDGRYLLYHQTGLKFLAKPMFGDNKPIVVLDTPFAKDQAKFSPDTHWIAYNATNSGRFEVYVTSFPQARDEIAVSKAGGVQPRWRGDGRELFFLDPESRLMSVDVRTVNDRLEFGAPRFLFKAPVEAIPDVELYDVTRDGQRFIMMVPVESSSSQMNVIVNWPSALPR